MLVVVVVIFSHWRFLHSFLFFILLLLFFIHFCSSFCCCCSSFIFVLHFVVAVLNSLLLNVIPHFSVNCHQVLTPILYCQPSPLQSDLRHFHFNLSRIFFHSFTASATVLSGDFFTHRRFLLYAPSSTFFLHLSRPPWEPAVLP